ncbi:MAG TPA: fumarate reductase subunit C [Burkholderiales bacterium]|nr:fumarate reductase subunit C [Burkholderiales bacterium]
MSRRPYVREESWRWVLRHPRYLRYMAREFSCLFIGAWTFLLIVGLKRLAEGPQAWEAFLAALRSPLSVTFHVVALAFAVYHSITWFNLTPKALPLQLGESFVPDRLVSGAHFLGWGVLSAAVLWLAGAF